jgi:hypothetical protein
MHPASEPPTVIEGRVVHKKSNALQIAFHDGPGEPIAVGLQGASEGKGKKLGILLGFKNGGTGKHRLTYSDGRILEVTSRDGAPSIFTTADDAPLATVTRGATSTAVLPDATELFTFAGDDAEAKTVDLFRLTVATESGENLGRLDIIRRVEGWDISRALEAAWNVYYWWDHAGQPLPVPILGTRLTLTRPVVGIERDVLLCACVDMAIGLRPYASAMN